MQADMYADMSKICQQFKKKKNSYGNFPPYIIAELKPWDLVNVDRIGPYKKSMRQQHLDSAIIMNIFILT